MLAGIRIASLPTEVSGANRIARTRPEQAVPAMPRWRQRGGAGDRRLRQEASHILFRSLLQVVLSILPMSRSSFLSPAVLAPRSASWVHHSAAVLLFHNTLYNGIAQAHDGGHGAGKTFHYMHLTLPCCGPHPHPPLHHRGNINERRHAGNRVRFRQLHQQLHADDTGTWADL